jgi:hypothetical protein
MRLALGLLERLEGQELVLDAILQVLGLHA